MVADATSGADRQWPGTAPDAADTIEFTSAELTGPTAAERAGSPKVADVDVRPDLSADPAPAEPASQRKQLWQAPRKMARRLSWGIADQGMSSLTNFAVGIYVIRSLGATEFGAFSIALVTYGFALNASRGLSTDPLMVRFSGVDLPVWRRAVASCTGTALTVGIVTGLCVLVAAAFVGGTIRLAFLGLGLTLPGLLLQDSWRYSFFALGRGSQAFLNDTIWAVVLFPSLWLLRTTGHANIFWLTLAWGVSATVGAAVGPLQARVQPRISGTRAWLSRHRDLGPRYLAEGVSSAGASQFRGYAIALFLGLAPLGYVQAANTITGPVAILFLGMALVTIPEAARVLRRSPRHLPLFCVLVSGGLSAGALAWGAFLYLAMPRGFGQLLIGKSWPETYPLVLPQALYLIGQGVAGGAGTGMHALGAARRSLRTVLIGSSLLVICPILGAVARGAVGTVEGMAVAAWLGAAISWWQLRIALRERRRKPVGDGLSVTQDGRHRRPTLTVMPLSGERIVASVGIGEILADARRKAGFTTTRLSERLGIPETVISAIERNDYSGFDDDYARNQIRTIAREVETNPVPLLEEYDADVAGPAAAYVRRGKQKRRATTPGRRGATWASISVLAVLLAAAGAVAFQHHVLTSRRPPPAAHRPASGDVSHRHAAPGPTARPSASGSPSAAAPAALLPVSAAAFGPDGVADGDNPQSAPLAIDGKPSTSWHTSWYASAHFGGLKTGTGLLLDMGSPVTITGVRITLGHARGADLEVRVGDAPTLASLLPVARATGASRLVWLPIARPETARYLLLWFTALPRDSAGTFEVFVYDVSVVGRR